jgi:hypothetical protein
MNRTETSTRGSRKDTDGEPINQSRRQILRAAIAAPVVVALGGCTRKQTESAGSTSGGVIRAGSATIPPSIKLTPQTVIVPAGERAIAGLSPDRKALHIVGADSIKAGSTVLLSDFGVFRAQAVQPAPDGLFITPAACALPDLISDGTIRFENVRIRPGDGKPGGSTSKQHAESTSFWDLFVPRVFAQEPSASSGKLGAFDYQIQYTATEDAVTFDAGAHGDLSGFAAKVSSNGHLEGFELSGNAEVRSGNPENLALLIKGLKGEVNLEASAERHDNAGHPGNQMLKIPHEFEWPIVIDGIPFLLKLGVALLLNEGLTNTQASARFGVKLKFKGSSGFDMPLPGEPSKADPKVDTSLDTDFSFQHAESVGLGPQALLVAMQCPRLAFGLGFTLPFVDVFAGPYVDIVTSASHTAAGAMSLVPCQRNQLVITGAVGCQANFLKYETPDIRKEAYRKEIVRALPDTKACRLES